LIFNQLLDGGVDISLVQILALLYSHQEVTIVWSHTGSSPFMEM